MTLCALTFSNTSVIEEALKYLLRIAAKLTHSMTKCLTVSGDRQAEHRVTEVNALMLLTLIS